MLRKSAHLTSRTPIGSRNMFSPDNFSKSKHLQENLEAAKTKLKWRVEPSANPKEWYSKFKLFGNDEQTSDLLSAMSHPIDLSPTAISQWWKKRNAKMERMMQMYLSERHEILGSDLATAHFILFRGGTVKFLNHSTWISADEKKEFDLPKRFDPNYKLEAIKFDNMRLFYEGVENIKRLQNLKFLSLRNVQTFDDWCFDRLSGLENPKLEILDLSGTSITERGLSAMYRLENLQVLIVDKNVTQAFELGCAMIEQFRPKLKIVSGDDIHSSSS